MTKNKEYITPCMDPKIRTDYPFCRPSRGRDNKDRCSIFIAIGCHGFYPSSDDAKKHREVKP